ncbi:hypothetical protein [Paraburkholderia sp. BL10I2N1]|uniref:hypothetical protein n=1 Tax=Paraburkholderia sp. BL10I2N1 TaxID=1938796 RepID=UPI00105EF17F|nr:hypothetical protein [Paraburkholderia sp. BL10I2N1]TDN59062.1 hypothetical protein B0G77_8250 [Paraburkholderia sp. BL10I2N1]
MSTDYLSTYAALVAIAVLLLWKMLQLAVDALGGPDWGGFALTCLLAIAMACFLLARRAALRPVPISDAPGSSD